MSRYLLYWGRQATVGRRDSSAGLARVGFRFDRIVGRTCLCTKHLSDPDRSLLVAEPRGNIERQTVTGRHRSEVKHSHRTD